MSTFRIGQSLLRGAHLLFLACVPFLFAQQLFAQTNWDGDFDQDWNNAANWASDPNPPTGNFLIAIDGTGPFPILSANSAFTPVDIIIGTASGFDGRLDQTAGTLSTGAGNWLRMGQAGGTGIFNLSGGTFTGRVHMVRVAGIAGTATINVSGMGTLTSPGEVVISDGQNNTATAQGTINVSDSGIVNSEGDLILAWAGNSSSFGELNIAAGATVNVASTTERWLIVNQWDSTQGRINVNGGTLNLNANTDIRFSTGNGVGTSVIDLNSGAITGGAGSVLDLNRNVNGAVNNTVHLDGGTLTIGQVISGVAAGTRVFNFNGGTLKAAGSSTTFFAAGAASAANVQAGGAIIDSNGFDITIGQALLNGAGGGLTKNGGGMLTLTGANTFTGATIVNNGTLYANPGNAANNRALSFTSGVTVNNGATLRTGPNGLFGWDGTQERPITVNAGGTLTANGGLGSDVGVGTVTLVGGNMTTLAGGATDWGSFRFDEATDKLVATEDSTVSAENVKFGNASAAIDVAAGKTLNFSGTITDTTNGGASFLTKNGGTGTLILTGANAYTNATTISAGTLQIGNGGTTGSLAAGTAITNNAAIVYNRSDALSVANTMSGTGTLTKQGAGTLTLTGANTHSGATNVNAGTLAFSTTQSSIGSLTVADSAGLSTKAAAASSTLLTTTSLTMGTAGTTNLTFDFSGLNPSVPQISTGALTLNGTVNVSLAATGGLVTNNYTLIDYTGALGGSFSSLTPTAFSIGHSSATLVDNVGNTSVDLNVIADSLVWSGAGVQTWTTAATGDNTPPNDWATKNGNAATNFWLNDAVEFNDTYDIGAGDVPVTNRTVTITGADISPAGVTFDNSTGDYNVTGSFGIAGATSVTKNGSSKVTISNSNSYTGGTTINAGTIAINSATSLGSASGALTLNNGTLQTTADISSARNITLGHANSTILVDPSTTYTVGGAVSGGGTLSKAGAGTLVLSGPNTYSGGTTITAGTVSAGNVTNNQNLGALASGVILDGGTLRLTHSVVANGIFGARTLTVNAGGGALTGQGGAGAAQDSRIIFNNANTLLGSGALAIQGTGGLDGFGGGKGAVVVAAAQSYSGAITLSNGGILALEGGGTTPLGSGATIAIGNQAELSIATGITVSNNVTVTGGTASNISWTNGGTGILAGTLTLNADVRLAMRNWYNAAAQNGTISGQITGTGNLNVIDGSGAVTISNGTNDYSGNTSVSTNGAQIIIGGGNERLPNGTVLDLTNGGKLSLNGYVETIKGLTGGSSNSLVQAIEATGGTVAGTTNASKLIIDTANTGPYTFAGIIRDRGIGGIVSVQKDGLGTQNLNLTTVGFYTGGTVVNGGTLGLGGTGGADVAARGTLTINSGATVQLSTADILGLANGITQVNVNGGTLNNNVAGNNSYLASWTLTGGTMSSTGGGAFNIRASAPQAKSITSNASTTESLISGNVVLRDAGTNSLSIVVADGAAANDLHISGDISETEGTNGFTKSGAGTLRLSGVNSYTGPTTVNAGTLNVDGSITSAVTVNGGLLGGNGSTGGVIVGLSGSISAGNSPGSLDINGDYAQSGTMVVDIAGTTQGSTYDLIAATGSGTLNTGSIVDVNLDSFNPGAGSFFDVFTALDINGGGNSLAGIIFDYTDAPLAPGLFWQQSIVGTGGGEALRLSVAAVPEPGTLAMLLAGVCGVHLLRRKRS